MALSVRTILASGRNKLGATITLTHRTAGSEIAGAGTREAAEGWAYLYEAQDGTRGGQWFASEAEARERFDKFNVEQAPAPDAPKWQVEFPDYPAADMPAIPSEWVDSSWHNDACPSFLVCPSLGVFVDYAEPAGRDIPNGCRFMALRMIEGQHVEGDSLFETDEWAEMLAYAGAFTTASAGGKALP